MKYLKSISPDSRLYLCLCAWSESSRIAEHLAAGSREPRCALCVLLALELSAEDAGQ